MLIVAIMGVAHRSLSIYLAFGLELSRAALSSATPKRRFEDAQDGTADGPPRRSISSRSKSACRAALRLAQRAVPSRSHERRSWLFAQNPSPSSNVANAELKRFLEDVHGGDIPEKIRRNVHRSLLQRVITLEDLVACEDDDLVARLLRDTSVFDGLMGPTYCFWFQCALRQERLRRNANDPVRRPGPATASRQHSRGSVAPPRSAREQLGLGRGGNHFAISPPVRATSSDVVCVGNTSATSSRSSGAF